jgi:hypothetical protein
MAPLYRRLSFFAALSLTSLSVFADVDSGKLRELISRADLHYTAPVARSEEGLPLGNGRMGSLVWTSPTALKFQINRVDVQSINRDTRSFPERNSDYMGGCGFVDIELGGASPDVFPADAGPQHLSIFDGQASIAGKGVQARLLAWNAQDVMAIEIEDQRANPEPIRVNLRMLRALSQYYGGELERMIRDRIVTVKTANHTATSQLAERDGRIILTQEFREGEHIAKSAVVIGIVGRDSKVRFADETEVRLVAPAGKGKFLVLIASAASLSATEDVVAAATQQLDAASRLGWEKLASDNAAWWESFWKRGHLDLRSPDRTAEFITDHYHYFLYLMAATSRGKFPPKFNGMIWNTAGDLRTWGAQHWFANLSCYYEALFASNRLDLIDPVFAMYSGMYDSAKTAARQQWGSEGIFIPEVAWFDGLATLPEDIAAEMRDLYLLRKPWETRSPRFMEFASTHHPHSSRWNWFGSGSWVDGRWVPVERGSGPYGPVSHIMGTTPKIAYLYWRRYEYTLDKTWLRDRAYPMIKGAAEFYRNFPNLRRGEDGKLHIERVNSNESVWGARDTDEDLSAMRGIFAAAVRAAEILGVDTELQGKWRATLAGLAPLPTSADPDALTRAGYTGPQVWVRGRKPAVNSSGFLPDGNSLPMWFFDLCNLDSGKPEDVALANATFEASFRGRPIDDKTPVQVLSKLAIAGATLGRPEAARFLVPNQIRVLTAERETAYLRGKVMANRMALREGPQAADVQSLGRASEAIQMALLQSNPPAPAAEPLLRLFPAWPSEWDASFTLRARGAFVVTASRQAGSLEFVEILSEAGAPCHLRNPWGDAEITLQRDGGPAERIRGDKLTIATKPGERLRLTR